MGQNLRYVVLDWCRAEALWRTRVAVLTAFQPTGADDLWAALKTEHDALYKEATDIADALSELAQGLTGRREFIASSLEHNIIAARDEVATFPADKFSPRAVTGIAPSPVSSGPGKLIGLGAAPGEVVAATGELWAFVKKCLMFLVGTATVLATGTGTYLTWRIFLRSPADRVADEAQAERAVEAQRQQALADCAKDPNPSACQDRVNRQYDAMLPSSCDILDTPLGSVLGTLVGIGVGYAGMHKIMSWG